MIEGCFNMNECKFCGNKNQHAFFIRHGKTVCRMCISHIKQIEEKLSQQEIKLEEKDYELPFKLTKPQKKASQEIIIKSKQNDVLVEAVCGAGKTELVIETIGEAIRNQKKVGWAIPRRQVVLQLAKRLQSVFKTINVIPVCQGFTSTTTADLIVCTTHQLYRYYEYFDLLIIDEPDAFPYKDNKMLQQFAKNSVKGKTIYLTATPSKEQIHQVKKGTIEHVTLYERPFRNALAIPKIKMMNQLFMLVWLKKYLSNTKNQTMIFVPTIKLAHQLGKLYSIPVVTSKSTDKEMIIQEFQKQSIEHLITTTILERGVTFSNIHVVVYLANHGVFDVASLIQISGRVGRDQNHPYGECYFLINEKTKEVNQCIKTIMQANTYAYGV